MKTGIVFFTMCATKEARRKTWHPQYDVNLKIANQLISNTRKTLKSSTLDILEITESKQRGSSFGEKICNAIADSFELGYDKLIVVGNDSPELTGKIIDQALFRLETDKLVIGPDDHGGIYLLGLTKEAFVESKTIIAELPWRKNNLFTAIEERFSLSKQLPELKSINTKLDLTLFIKNVLVQSLSHQELKFLIDCQREQLTPEENTLDHDYILDNHFSRRGPPILFS